MFAMPGPASFLVASVWLGLLAFVLVALLRALVLAWKDTRTPGAYTLRWGTEESESPRAAA
jgi:hypothetical protein